MGIYGYFDRGYDIMSFIRRRSGSSWVHIEEFRRRSGSSWVITNRVRRRSGLSWINVMQGITLTVGSFTVKTTTYGFNSELEFGSVSPDNVYGNNIISLTWPEGGLVLNLEIEGSHPPGFLTGCSFEGFGYAPRSNHNDAGTSTTFFFGFDTALPQQTGTRRVYFYGGA